MFHSVTTPHARTHAPQSGLSACANAALPWLLTTAICALPFYKGLFNTAVALYVLCWLLAGNWAHKWRRFTNNQPAQWWAALTLWVLMGMLYVPLPWGDLDKPTTFVIKGVFMLMAMLAIEQQHLRWYVTAFVVTNLWVVFITLGWQLELIPLQLQTVSGQWLARASTDHISQGIRLALTAGLLLYVAQASVGKPVYKTLALVAGACAAAFVVGYLATGRTGYIALVAVGLVFAVWRRPPRRWLLGIALIGLLAYGAYSQSSTVQNQVNRVFSQSQMSAGDARDHTSVGARMAMWSFALQAIQERPMLGAGSGGYPAVATAHFKDTTTCSIGCAHAHNQFLFFGVENGLIGMALFIGFIASALTAAWRVSAPLVSGAAASVMAVLVTDSLTHGPFWIANEFHLFAMALPVALAAVALQQNKQSAT
ncbi:MAG: O-antigen ligase family protein [Burkholderiaceae bacterium]|jgi:O-antigen ligase